MADACDGTRRVGAGIGHFHARRAPGDVTIAGMDEFPVDDQQREAALAHLASEHASGVFDTAELHRRTAEVKASVTVAQLLAATADPAVTDVSTPSPAAQQNRLALGAGIVVAIILVLAVLSQLT